MNAIQQCPECGADWSQGQTCLHDFYLMGGWELENGLYEVHHLMVLCYYLQHPSLYSPTALNGAKTLLHQFLELGLTPQEARENMRRSVDAGNRPYKITGTPASHGGYEHPITWRMTCRLVTQAGLENYYHSVRSWADAVLQDLRDSSNF